MSDFDSGSRMNPGPHWEPTVLENKPSWVLPGPFDIYSRNDFGTEEWGPKPLSEMGMYELSWTLRSKPDWQRKAADPEIRGKWRKEALEQVAAAGASDCPLEENLMTEKMVEYILAELDGQAKIADKERGIERGCFDAIWYSDRLISNDVLARLKSTVRALEDVPETEEDWHPGSDNQVLDLVHPSLYCIVYGRTHAYLPGKPRTAANFLPVHAPEAQAHQHAWTSQDFCWMPSDFAVTTEGSVTLISPYINNLDPRLHQPLYCVIEQVLASFVPMFERVLGDTNRENRHAPPFADSGRLEKITCIWGPGGEPYPEEEPGSDEDEEEFLEHFLEGVEKMIPEANEYAGQLEARFAPVSLRGRTIQCIVKLANIHLTPERPEYKGGSWHVEGMVNESIVASGIYYYDEENITESKLSFRMAVGEPKYHAQDDSECMRILYGMDRNSECIQEIGAMVTKAGRALSWPNLFQHRVSPFKLADPSKPGYRKILALFLVDPAKDRIVSATDVPPQQAEWAAEACGGPTSVLARLPLELRDAVKDQFPATVMARKEAEAYRLELMKERTAFVEEHTERAYGQTFNLCEH
ncbi:hypothetical protein DFH07DRAFT_869429 [Mycena maculata]|uniref:Uncharacterized protein n=1 Tax=Mycena maculata TaxID=230809 RepID=A0AAD7N7G2_9AGAR|nr:hypothetical protein DFH07DRAFT_869429 [Mycena maculata]